MGFLVKKIILHALQLKDQSNDSTIALKSSPTVITEWLPINVMPKYVPSDVMKFNNNEICLIKEQDLKNKLAFNRMSNPFLLHDTDQLESRLVCFITSLEI